MEEKCQNNGLEHIFYEAYENKFYERNKEIIDKFIQKQFSNLNYNNEMIIPVNIMND